MVDKTIRIGSMEDVHVYDDGDYDSGIEVDHPMKAAAPIDPNDVVILGSEAPGAVTPVAVVDIDDPSAELNALPGVLGSVLLCHEIEAASDQCTLYAFDASDTGGEDVPYSVDADIAGLWLAVGGKYLNNQFFVKGNITLTGSVFLPNGAVGAPSVAFTANTDCGIYYTPGGGGTIYTSINGANIFSVNGTDVSSLVWFRVITGAVGALSITFGNDINTGFYSPGADQVGIATNGALRVHVSNTETKIGGAANYLEIAADGSIEFNGTARIDWQKITANGLTLGGGPPTSGDALADLQIAFDGDNYQVDEIAGNAGQYLEIDFASVTAFNWVRVRMRVQEQGGHALTIQLEITPFDGTAWHDYDVVTDQAADINYEDHSFFVITDTPYINGGVVKLRITHEMAGNAADEWHIDEVALYR